MCNINAIFNIEGKKTKNLTECMNVVSFHSYTSNKDSEGFYTESHKVHRSLSKQIMSGAHSEIVSHQRISTSGKNESMTQPLESKHFIITHNGVFSSLGDTEKSDTYYYLQQLEEAYALSKNTQRAIAKVNKDNSGSYSIILYNKETGEHYYYKSLNKPMFFAKSKQFLMLSTKEENVEYMVKFFGVHCNVEEVQEHKIFDLNNKFKIVGSFKEKERTYYKTYTDNSNSDWWKSSYYGTWKKSTADITHNDIKAMLREFGIPDVRVGMSKQMVTISYDKSEVDQTYFESMLYDIRPKAYREHGNRCIYEYLLDDIQEVFEVYNRYYNDWEEY